MRGGEPGGGLLGALQGRAGPQKGTSSSSRRSGREPHPQAPHASQHDPTSSPARHQPQALPLRCRCAVLRCAALRCAHLYALIISSWCPSLYWIFMICFSALNPLQAGRGGQEKRAGQCALGLARWACMARRLLPEGLCMRVECPQCGVCKEHSARSSQAGAAACSPALVPLPIPASCACAPLPLAPPTRFPRPSPYPFPPRVAHSPLPLLLLHLHHLLEAMQRVLQVVALQQPCATHPASQPARLGACQAQGDRQNWGPEGHSAAARQHHAQQPVSCTGTRWRQRSRRVRSNNSSLS